MTGLDSHVRVRQARYNDVDDVLYLVRLMLDAEREDTPILPELLRKRYRSLRKHLGKIMGYGYGTVAEVHGQIEAFLVFDSLYKDEGSGLLTTWSPLEFNAFREKSMRETVPALLTFVMDRLAKKGAQQFGITSWTHAAANAMLAEFGFGVHRADGIVATDHIVPFSLPDGITIERHIGMDIEELRPLRNGLIERHSGSPMFFTRRNITAKQWAAHKRHFMPWFFVAREGETPIGYIEIGGEGENIVEEADGVQSIRELAVAPEWRGKGIEEALVGTLLSDLAEREWPLATADYVTMDPDARELWPVFFREYARTFVRRIDSRLVEK